jgi:hypothetical protein
MTQFTLNSRSSAIAIWRPRDAGHDDPPNGQIVYRPRHNARLSDLVLRVDEGHEPMRGHLCRESCEIAELALARC